jgi:ubiquinone biosynthesis protein UbiJ
MHQEGGAVIDRPDLTQATPDELAELAEAVVAELARRADPDAFAHLLRMTGVVGQRVGVAARSIAERGSWAGVADLAGTSRQAAWERWRSP